MIPPLRAVLAVFVILTGLWDLRWRRIPNFLTIPALALGFLLQGAYHGWPGLKTAAAGFGVALLITLPLFVIRGLGGGDVKLMAATGAMTGHELFLVIFIVNAVVGGVIAIMLALAKGRLRSTFSNVGRIFRSFSQGEAPHAQNPDLDIASPQAITMPRGTIYAACVLLILAFGQS